MKKHLSKKRVVLAAIVTVALAIASGVAYAYFTSTSTGSGSATVGDSTPWTVTAATATGGPLTPGGLSQSVVYTVKNESTGNQHLANVAIKVADADGLPWASGSCTAGDFAINSAAAGATANDTSKAGTIAPGGEVSATITLKMVNLDAPQDDCKNVDVPLYLSAS